MARSVGVNEARTHLSKLITDVAQGEDVLITRRGEVVARLTAPPPSEHVFGTGDVRLVIRADWDHPDASGVVEALEGRGRAPVGSGEEPEAT